MKKYIPLEVFIKRAFYSLSPCESLMNNWHIAMLSHILEMVYEKKIKKLIICMPPRYLKSVCVSVAFPAWVLGNDDSKKIIVASYAMPLAEKLSIDTKNIMMENWYKEYFPQTTINAKINNKRKFLTTQNGFRLATSVNGSLTGEGGDILIADDPQKPLEIMGKKYREKTYNWLLNTFFSRLNNKKNGAIIIVMQRLHAEDLVGKLTENKMKGKIFEKINGWTVLNLCAVAENTDEFRSYGEVLNQKTEDINTIKNIKRQIGEYFFQAQYQQNPKSGKSLLKKSQMFFSGEDFSEFISNGIFLSIDCAFKTGENNDFTAITLWAIKKSTVILFDVILEKMELSKTQNIIENLMKKYSVLQILIEDKASGISLIQILQKKYCSKIVKIKITNAKDVRFCSALPYVQSGQVVFAKNINPVAIKQMTEFPNTKNDDIVDSISQFVNWYFIYRKEYTEPFIREF